jgi:hypothetical protein
MLIRKFRRPMIFWMGSYLTGRTQRVRVGDYLSETIYCHFGVPRSSHLGPLFSIADINDVLGIFENVRVLMLMTWSCACVLAALTIIVCFSRTWTTPYRVGVVRRSMT